MPCQDYAEYGDFLRNGQFFDAIYCPFADQLGVTLAGVMFFGAIGIALYVYTDSIAVPLSLTVIVGAAVMTQVPAIATTIVGAVIIVGFAIAAFVLIMRLLPQ